MNHPHIKQYKNFLTRKQLPLPELQATLYELEHLPTGAKVMHIANDDPENLFSLSFQTIPSSSNGVAHILEHTVLCGSRKFPVKDPFFAMTRRSLNTFMNALTGADFTCYPAATQVEKDFYNLLDVYLDAVFHPELKKESFLQEGHRLELTDPNNLNSPLIWKGVVYNEMKGAMAPADTRLWHAMMEALVPDLTYAFVSGGDPAIIPSLSYEELIHFHDTYYHPSRCLFFFYGNLPLENHLDFIEERVLKNCTKEEPLPPLPKQKRFTRPVERVGYYPVEERELENKTIVAWGWLTVAVQDQETLLAITLLDAILMETDASLLKLSLLQSGLCRSADASLDIEMSEVPLLIVCKGCNPDNIEALENLLLKTLQEIVDNGIPPHLIEAALHQLEFSRTEIVGDHAPFGLTLFMRSALAKQHGCAPENGLVIHSLFEKLRAQLQDPTYLPRLITTYLIANPHRVRLTLKPDPDLGKKESDDERSKLAELEQSLSKRQREEIVQEMHHLAEYQKKIEDQDLDCLPQVTLHDVPALARQLPLQHHNSLFFHDCFTNHIVYADLVFDLPHLTEDDLACAQFLVSILPELGVGKQSYIQNLEYLQTHVGSLSMSMALFAQVEDSSVLKPSLTIRGKALNRNLPHLFAAMKNLALDARLDERQRIEELLSQIDTALKQRLPKNSLRYASQLALSSLSPAANISEKWHGLSYFKWIEKMMADRSRLFPQLERLRATLLSLQNPQLVLTCDRATFETVEKEGCFGLLDLPQKDAPTWRTDITPSTISSHARPIANPVAFSCEAFKVCSYLHPHAPALTVATHLLENRVLFPKIREQGGAYGCGASYASMNGLFSLHAYRDPQLAQTVETFREAIETIANADFEPSDLEAAKLETIQQFDTPIAPGSRGSVAYSWLREGKTVHHRQRFRDALLQLTPREVALAVKKELLGKTGVVVAFGGKELLEKEGAKLEKPLPIIPI